MPSLSLPVLVDKPKTRKAPSNGVVLYAGPSRLTAEPIVVVATGIRRKSRNVKTGKMIQIWIMADMGDAPLQAHKKGDDKAVCGDCKHRHFGSCYVNLGQGVMHIYDAYQRGVYEEYSPESIEYFRGQQVRFGAYGDPAAVPMEVWQPLLDVVSGHTAYTHQWARGNNAYQSFCMASCDTAEEAAKARSRGWRPFLVRLPGDPKPDNTYDCPASDEAGNRMDCMTCKGCQGGALKHERMATPTIVAHGPSFKMLRYKNGMDRIRLKRAYRGLDMGLAACS